ncbi:MAG: helix-turn-helix domain-containing protein [Defluviicoccus sp.]
MFTHHLRPNELAARWRISPRTLERWRWIGAGPRFLKVSGRVLYRIEDIEVFEAAHIRSRTEDRVTSAVIQPFRPKRGKRRDPVIAAIAAGSLRHRRVAN